MKMDTRKTGIKGEEIALDWLKKQNVKIVEKNFLSRFGEIDIIGIKEKTLIFYEVKYRRNNNYGDGHTSINEKKKSKLVKTAMFFLLTNKDYMKLDMRFDAIIINESDSNSKNTKHGKKSDISFIKNFILTDNNKNGFFY